MNYGFTDADVSRRLSSLGLGRPPGLQNTASLGTQPNHTSGRQGSSSPLSGSYSSMLSNSQNNNNNNNSSKFSPRHSESLMRLASNHSVATANNNNNSNSMMMNSNQNNFLIGGVGGKPPIVPPVARMNLQAPLLDGSNNNNNNNHDQISPDPERRTFSPQTAKNYNSSNNLPDGDDVNILFSPEATTSTKNKTPRNDFVNSKISFKDDDDHNNNGEELDLEKIMNQNEENNINSYSTPSHRTSNDNNNNNSALLSSVNWPNLVEVLNLVVEKLNCQLSLVDSVIVGGGILPQQQQQQQQIDENNNNNSNNNKQQKQNVKQSSISPTQFAKKVSWAKTLQQHASETLEMVEYNLRHSSFGIKDVSSRLGAQLDQLKSDLGVLFTEAIELDDILRKNETKTSAKEVSSKSSNTNNPSSSTSLVDLWANGYLQRLSVAHDLTQRILFESARYITRASSLSPFYNDKNNVDDENNHHSPFYFRYHEGVALLDQIDPKKVLVSSNILLTSCEQYARCCLMEYEKRMRERCELYARASFVELNVIIPMTSQVASMQLSLDEKESNLRLVASRAGKAEQRLYESRIEFGETERKLREEIAQLKKQNDVLIRGGGGGGSVVTNNKDNSVLMTTPTKNNENNSSQHQSGYYLSAHQEDALARGKRLNLSRNELLKEEEHENEIGNNNNNGNVTVAETSDTYLSATAMVTPRTKSYHDKYLVKSDFSASKINNNNTASSPQQFITPGAAERMMEQVKMQLADEYSSNLVQIHKMEEQIDERIFGGLTNISVEMMNHPQRFQNSDGQVQKNQQQQQQHDHSVSFASPEAVVHARNVNNRRFNTHNNNNNIQNGITISGGESPLQKLARMSSPITPSSAVAQQRLQELQQQHPHHRQNSSISSSPIPKDTKSNQLRMNMNNNNFSTTSAAAVRSPRKEVFSTSANKNNKAATSGNNLASSPASSSSSPLSPSLSRDPNKTNNNNNNNNFREPQSIKMLDLANDRINQQIETAKTSFLAMKEKYGAEENSSLHLVSTPRGSSLGTYPTSILKSQQQPSTIPAAAKDVVAVAPSSSYSYLNQKKAHVSFDSQNDNNNKKAHDASLLNASQHANSSNGCVNSNMPSSPSSRQRLILLEQLVLEQRSELSTLKAHLKGIESQEAEVGRKRETVATSLRQAQSRIDFASEEELRETNDRLTLVWEKIEEATNRLRQNRREVLSKMELMSRTLRNSEKEWNKARTELTKNGVLV